MRAVALRATPRSRRAVRATARRALEKPGRALGPTAFALLSLLGPGCGEPSARRVDTVVLLTVDTLRRDHVSCYVEPGGRVAAATPALDALARRGVRFADARTPTPLTLPAHTTMLTGLPPASHGMRSNAAARLPPPSARPFSTLPEALADAGWCCGAFVSAGPLVERFGLSAGFSAYDDVGLEDRSGGGFAERPGMQTVDRALAWLRAAPKDRRIFLWVHLFEPHHPHRTTYAADVEEADAVASALLLGVAAARPPTSTAILFTSDHGEALGEQGEPTHGLLLGESVLRVPFVLAAPGLGPDVRRDPVDLADVAPTLAALARVPFVPGGRRPGSHAKPDARPVGWGLDLVAAAAPASRPRVAEGLHAHHQHRWAQLTAAVVGGVKLEDRGEGRQRLFVLGGGPSGVLEEADAVGRDDAQGPAAALRAYRRGETAAPDPGATAAGGYGGGGAVGRLLDPTENGRLPDPYAVVSDAARIDRAAAAILALPVLPARVRAADQELETIDRRDPGNPTISFWRGRAARTLAGDPASHRRALAYFLEAMERGRADPDTLLLAARSAIAAEGPAEALSLLETWRAVPRDARHHELIEAAATAVGDPTKAAQAREAARMARQPSPRPAPDGRCP